MANFSRRCLGDQ